MVNIQPTILNKGEWTVVPACSQTDLEMRLTNSTGIIAVPVDKIGGFPLLAMHIPACYTLNPAIIYGYLMVKSHAKKGSLITIGDALSQYLDHVNKMSSTQARLGIHLFSGIQEIELDINLLDDFRTSEHILLGAHLRDSARVTLKPWRGIITVKPTYNDYGMMEYDLGVKHGIWTPLINPKSLAYLLSVAALGPNH